MFRKRFGIGIYEYFEIGICIIVSLGLIKLLVFYRAATRASKPNPIRCLGLLRHCFL